MAFLTEIKVQVIQMRKALAREQGNNKEQIKIHAQQQLSSCTCTSQALYKLVKFRHLTQTDILGM